MVKIGILKCNKCLAENELPPCSILEGAKNPDKIYSRECGFCGSVLSKDNYTEAEGGKECSMSFDGFHEERGRIGDEGNPLNYRCKCKHCGQLY